MLEEIKVNKNKYYKVGYSLSYTRFTSHRFNI